LVNTWTECIFN